MPDITRVNDTIYSWNSTLHKIDNQPWSDIVAVDWEQKIDAKVVFTAKPSRRPRGSTTGKWTMEGFSIKLLRDSADAFTDYLCTKTGTRSYLRARFNYLLQVTEPFPGARPLVASAVDCRVIGEKDATEEGIDELLTEYTLLCLNFSKNGKTLWSDE